MIGTWSSRGSLSRSSPGTSHTSCPKFLEKNKKKIRFVNSVEICSIGKLFGRLFGKLFLVSFFGRLFGRLLPIFDTASEKESY